MDSLAFRFYKHFLLFTLITDPTVPILASVIVVGYSVRSAQNFTLA